jgi:hypothetical protein
VAFSTPLLRAVVALPTWPFFSFGPLGFLDFPGAYAVELGGWPSFGRRSSICLSALLCLASRRAFGQLSGVAITALVASMPSSDPVLITAAVVGAAARLDEWSPRLRLGFALGAGA